MPDHSPSSSLPSETRKSRQGIDLPRAYQALIRGFVQVKTSQALTAIERERDEHGEQQ